MVVSVSISVVAADFVVAVVAAVVGGGGSVIVVVSLSIFVVVLDVAVGGGVGIVVVGGGGGVVEIVFVVGGGDVGGGVIRDGVEGVIVVDMVVSFSISVVTANVFIIVENLLIKNNNSVFTQSLLTANKSEYEYGPMPAPQIFCQGHQWLQVKTKPRLSRKSNSPKRNQTC